MKKVLILAIGCSLPPWDKMAITSCKTWDSVEVEGCETIFYFGEPVKENTDKFIYFPIVENYHTMGHKMLSAFEWVLANKKFDYIARVNSSCFVDKKELIKYIQELPDDNVFSGLKVIDENNGDWCWGGGQFVLSKDVIKKIVDNKELWNHGVMEDISLSHIVSKLEIPFTAGKACSIDSLNSHWRCIVYGGGGESFEFGNFEELKKLDNHFFYRVKQDGKRYMEPFIMETLLKTLNT